jgi:hypothetical protein
VLGQGHDENPGPSRQGGTELNDFDQEAPAIPATELEYGRIEELEARVSTLEDHATSVLFTKTETERLEQMHAAVEPWVGPEGQLRVRLERMEQAVFALIQDPNNPVSSAAQARAILTAIPTPAA